MARRSLKPQLNQIRAWVRQGRTDAWIAHQLEISTTELREFRDEHELSPDAEDAGTETDLRDEIEAEIEAATAAVGAEEPEDAEDAEAPEDADEPEDGEEPEEQSAQGTATAPARRRRRRGRRGGRGRPKPLEATFDHGENEGYGLWLDPAVRENPTYAEHWAGKRAVTVRIEADQIVIRRAESGEADDSDD
jgi:hypothetical protein